MNRLKREFLFFATNINIYFDKNKCELKKNVIGIERAKLVHETGVYGNEMRNFVHEMWLPGGSGLLIAAAIGGGGF